jgi:hypothetical protein
LTQKDSLIIRLNIAGMPVLFSALVGLLVGLLLTALALRLYQDRQEQLLLADYGQAMASMAASRAVDATLNHDLVSLQVILQDAVNNPRALLASIHDVENNLLVQAGDTKSLAQAHRSFSAPIPLQDAVAGYVTVHLQGRMPESAALFYSFVGLATLLFMAVLLSMSQWRGPVFVRVEKALPEEVPEAAASEAPALVAPQRQQAYLCWRFENLALLRQQISAERLQHILAQVERSLAQVASVCGASRWQPEEPQAGEYWLRCETTAEQSQDNNDPAEPNQQLENAEIAAFYAAVVCADLLNQLNRHEKITPVFYSRVAATPEEVLEAQWECDKTRIYCVPPGVLSALWEDVFFFNEVPGGLLFQGFVPPLDDQVAEQLLQLQARLGKV